MKNVPSYGLSSLVDAIIFSRTDIALQIIILNVFPPWNVYDSRLKYIWRLRFNSIARHDCLIFF